MRHNAGFTLIELLVVLAIIAILAVLAAPSFGSVLADQRMKQAVYNLNAVFSEARNQAAMLRRPIEVRFSADGLSVVLVTTTVTPAVPPATESTTVPTTTVLQTIKKPTKTIFTKSSTADFIRFLPNGNVSVSTASANSTSTPVTAVQTFRVCDASVSAEKGYTLILTQFGTTRVQKGIVTIDSDTVGRAPCL